MAPKLNPALRSFWQTKARYRVLYGGRASSKSHDAAGNIVRLARLGRFRFLCARQFQNKISESVYTLIKSKIEAFKWQKFFKLTRDKIICTETGTEFLFYGIWRSIDEIKSLEGIDVLWIEEAHNLSKEQWEILAPTIRKQGSEIWIIFNPRLASDFVYKNFVINPPKGALVRHINYTENPFLSRTMIEMIEDSRDKDPERFRHIYLGEPITDDGRAVIKQSWVRAAIDAHLMIDGMEDGDSQLGFDIADAGDDECAIVRRKGVVVREIDKWSSNENELLKSCSRAYNCALYNDSSIIYDCVGIGATAGSKFEELNDIKSANDKYYEIEHTGFNAGGGVKNPDYLYDENGHVTNKDKFANSKAQEWWYVADRFRATYEHVNGIAEHDPADMISISSECSHLDLLIDELTTPRRDYDPAGRDKVESKKDLAKRGIASPNVADALIMAYYKREKSLADLFF